MKEKELADYTKWLMETWNPGLYIPFAIDAPQAYLNYKRVKDLTEINEKKYAIQTKK